MNRRTFINKLAAATAGASVLPSAALEASPEPRMVCGVDIGTGASRAGWCFAIEHNGAFVYFNDPHSGPVPAQISIGPNGDIYATRVEIGTYELKPDNWETGRAW